MAELITGLDIGGAHLKVAQVEPGGRIVAVSQIPCELWLGLDRLEEASAETTRAVLDASERLTTSLNFNVLQLLVISIAMAAVRLVLEGGVIVRATVAVGACSPVAQRLPAVEAALHSVQVV